MRKEFYSQVSVGNNIAYGLPVKPISARHIAVLLVVSCSVDV